MHSLMGKWALLMVAGFLGCSLSLSAQTAGRTDLLAFNRPDRVAVDLSTLHSARYGLPALTLLDGQPLSLSSAYMSIEPTPVDFLPPESMEISTRARSAGSSAPDSDYKTVEVKPRLIDYVHGEVGAFYGRSAGGKFSREVEAGYILGEIGNDKTQINVGAFYEHSSAHFPRR